MGKFPTYDEFLLERESFETMHELHVAISKALEIVPLDPIKKQRRDTFSKTKVADFLRVNSVDPQDFFLPIRKLADNFPSR